MHTDDTLCERSESLLSLPLAHRQMMGGAPNASNALDAWGSAKGKGKGEPGEQGRIGGSSLMS